jgi:hypothetical protein
MIVKQPITKIPDNYSGKPHTTFLKIAVDKPSSGRRQGYLLLVLARANEDRFTRVGAGQVYFRDWFKDTTLDVIQII